MTPSEPVAPYSVYQRVSVIPEFTQADGNLIDNVIVQIDVYADTYADATKLADAIRTKLTGPNFNAVPQSMTDIFETEIRLFRIMQDFSFWIPTGTEVSFTTPAGLSFDPTTGRFI